MTLRPGEISADLRSARRSAISASASDRPRVRRIGEKPGRDWCGVGRRAPGQVLCRRGSRDNRESALLEAAAVECASSRVDAALHRQAGEEMWPV